MSDTNKGREMYLNRHPRYAAQQQESAPTPEQIAEKAKAPGGRGALAYLNLKRRQEGRSPFDVPAEDTNGNVTPDGDAA